MGPPKIEWWNPLFSWDLFTAPPIKKSYLEVPLQSHEWEPWCQHWWSSLLQIKAKDWEPKGLVFLWGENRSRRRDNVISWSRSCARAIFVICGSPINHVRGSGFTLLVGCPSGCQGSNLGVYSRPLLFPTSHRYFLALGTCLSYQFVPCTFSHCPAVLVRLFALYSFLPDDGL